MNILCTSLLAGTLFVLKVLKWSVTAVLAGTLGTLKVLKWSVIPVLAGTLGTLEVLKWLGELPQWGSVKS